MSTHAVHTPLPVPPPPQPLRRQPAATGTRTSHARPREVGRATHRLDIEGLRGVAVILVVLFHAGIAGVAGGFIGVDVFFVISGFLITGLLLRELNATGTVSLPAFYARRALRLLPAAALVLVVTLVASVVCLPPLLVPAVAGDVTAASLYVSNIGFAVQATDYFAAGQAPSPILHYWSLGVEEQFYLFWPALVLLAARATGFWRWRIGAIMAVVAGASFVLSLWLTSAAPAWAFFSLPTRAWELGLGGLIAVGAVRIARAPAPIATAAGWLGLLMIVGGAVILEQTVPFPGTAAILPAVGAGLVLASGARAATPLPGRWLGSAVPRFFGRISYSLYLWHWPVLVIPAIAIGQPLDLGARIGLATLSVALATVTVHAVEDPIRHGRFVGLLPRRSLAMAGGLSIAVVLAATAVGGATAGSLRSHPGAPVSAASNAASLEAILNGLASESPPGPTAAAAASPVPVASRSAPPAAAARPAPTGRASQSATPGATTPGASTPAIAGRNPPSPAVTREPSPPAVPIASRPATPDGPVPADLQPALGDARADLPLSYVDGCHTQEDGHANTGTCLYGNLASSTTIALFGDSHALAWFPAVNAFAQAQGWRFLSLTMSTCAPATIPIWVPAWNRVSWECNNWRDQAIQRLIAEHPAIIVIAGTRGFATTDPSGGTVLAGDARTQEWQSGMAKTLARLVPAAGRVILLADTPLSRVDPPVCLSQHPSSVLACATPIGDAINETWLGVEQDAAQQAGAGFIDPERWICPSSPCPVVLGNFLVFRDAGHLTATFAQALGGRLGAAVLADVARNHTGAAP
jgi:peptidoglycan/LPS O-acetylase OafA/YrhL